MCGIVNATVKNSVMSEVVDEQKLPYFTAEEVAKHNTAEDCWLIIENKVYDVTDFLAEHPGGQKVVLREAGKDATKKFKSLHSAAVLPTYGTELLIGRVGSQSAMDNTKSFHETARALIERMGGFGELVPYGDPNWYYGFNSQYYNDSHRKVRAAMRAFVDKEVMPYCHKWDEEKRIPMEMFKKAADYGFLGAAAGSTWNTKYAGTNVVGGIKPEEYDVFHTFIIFDELSRCGSGGFLWGLLGGIGIGLPPVVNFGSEELKDRVVPECVSGRKAICLCVTEPYAGSDVANLRTTAKKTPDGKHYIVNGEKKWITNGIFADYFTVAVRTGGEGAMGVSLLLLERTMPGIKTTQMQCSGVWSSGTTYITFEDVKVPVGNLIGKENEGFRCIMYNFNHERWGMAVEANRFARVCLEESILYAMKRRTFGKPLIKHQVIRHKLAEMASRVEATHNWLENLTYQMKTMDHQRANMQLGGQCALIKAQASRNLEFCAREAQQVFGGLGYTRGGQGEKVERLAREVRAYAVPAGSEEIMLDLAVKIAERQASGIRKSIKKMAAKM